MESIKRRRLNINIMLNVLVGREDQMAFWVVDMPNSKESTPCLSCCIHIANKDLFSGKCHLPH